MNGFNIKEKIERNVKNAIKEFEAREDITTKFGDPVIGYANAKDPLFDMFLYKGLSKHPKEVYRPGNTVVLHFVPFAEDVIESNKDGKEPSEEWSRAFTESMWLSMRLNGVIRETLDLIGRLSSCTNTPSDWNQQIYHENWSHKMAAYVAGMGEFGPAGCFRTADGKLGRISSVITDGFYADGFEELDAEQAEAVYQDIMTKCCFAGAVNCSDEMIAVCPAGAISKKGIDREKCQNYCRTINDRIPSPDVCGKCFRF